MNARWLQKWYTRGIGIFFVLVALSLVADFLEFGHRPETWHKIFHVVVGATILVVGWNNERVWRPFCLINGAFFTFVAAFGWIFPDFGGLDAFNRLDTILHSIVGGTGLLIGLLQSPTEDTSRAPMSQTASPSGRGRRDSGG